MAASEGARDPWHADLVGGRVMGARPDDVAELEVLEGEGGHPFLVVRVVEVASWESDVAGGDFLLQLAFLLFHQPFLGYLSPHP